MAHDEVSEKLTPTAVAMACVPFPVGVRNYIVAFLNSNGTYEKHMTKLWLRKFEIGLERGVSLGGLEEMWCAAMLMYVNVCAVSISIHAASGSTSVQRRSVE